AGTAGRILGRGSRGDRLGAAPGAGSRQKQPAVLPLVFGWPSEYVLERARPPCRGGTRRADRVDLGQPRDRRGRALHLPRDARPRVVLTASCGIETNRIIPYKPLLDAAIAEARAKPDACVVLQRPMCQADLMSGRDYDWQEREAAARPADCVPVLATDPLYI